VKRNLGFVLVGTLAGPHGPAPDSWRARGYKKCSATTPGNHTPLFHLSEVAATVMGTLDSAARELQKQGATVIGTPADTLSACIIRFRWDDSVLEIDLRRGSSTQVYTRSRARLDRQQAKDRSEILKRYLAYALAELEFSS